MQGVGGIKGSQVLRFDQLVTFANTISAPIVQKDRSFSEKIPLPLKLRTRATSFNYLNSWRNDGQYLPIEFLYTPAEYRMFYTRDMFRRASAIHEAARDIAWGGAKEMSGGPYTPVMGFDGSKFKWPKGSGASGGKGRNAVTGEWESLGALIWEKLNKDG